MRRLLSHVTTLDTLHLTLSFCLGYLPAKRILMRSNGCSISVDVTPPETPATRCSYLTWENTLTFILLALAGVALLFILIWFTSVTLYSEFIYLFLCSVQLVLLYIYNISILYFFIIYNLWRRIWFSNRIEITETRCTWQQCDMSCC